MKTTIEIPDELFREAKATAAKRGISLKSLITKSIRASLASAQAESVDRPWMKFYGGLGDVPADELAAIDRRIAEECERVDEKDWS